MLSKWDVLWLASAVTFGGYFSFDTPSVLHDQLEAHFEYGNKNYDPAAFEFHFSLIYSLYSLPNMILPFIGGYLSDKYGSKPVLLAFSLLVFLGNIIIAVACLSRAMPIYIFGRFVFGLGLESVGVVAGAIIAKWFQDQELAFALGINLSLCKLGNVLSDWIVPEMHATFGMNVTMCLVCFLCGLSFLSTLTLIKYEGKHDSDEGGTRGSSSSGSSSSSGAGIHDSSIAGASMNGAASVGKQNQLMMVDINDNNSKHSSRINDNRSSNKNNNMNASSLNDEHSALLPSNYGAIDNSISENALRIDQSDRNSSAKPIFSATVWLVFVFTFIMSGILLPFTNISNVLILELYYPSTKVVALQRQHEIHAARLQSIPYVLSVVLAPFLGVSLDWFGHRAEQLLLSAVLAFIAHALMTARLQIAAVVPLLLIGLSYSVFASIVWAVVPIIVALEHQATAYGIMTAFQNMAQTLVPIALEQIYQHPHTLSDAHAERGFSAQKSYIPCEKFFALASIVACILGLLMWGADEWLNKAAMRVQTSGDHYDVVVHRHEREERKRRESMDLGKWEKEMDL